MKTAITGGTGVGRSAPTVLRGSFTEIIATAARIGYDGVELHMRDAVDVDRDRLVADLGANGIALLAIATGHSYGFDHLSLTSPEATIRQAAAARLIGHIHTAADHGAVVIIGLIKGLLRESEGRDAYLKRLRTALDLLVPVAEEKGVVLGLEVINRYESDIFNTIEETLPLIEAYDSPALRLHLDSFHMNIEEADIVASLRRAGGRIGHFHIADSDRWYAGHGHYDFAATIGALDAIGYEGALSVESLMYPEPEESARKSLETLRRCLGGLRKR